MSTNLGGPSLAKEDIPLVLPDRKSAEKIKRQVNSLAFESNRSNWD